MIDRIDVFPEASRPINNTCTKSTDQSTGASKTSAIANLFLHFFLMPNRANASGSATDKEKLGWVN
jgi:hypothetical protein